MHTFVLYSEFIDEVPIIERMLKVVPSIHIVKAPRLEDIVAVTIRENAFVTLLNIKNVDLQITKVTTTLKQSKANPFVILMSANIKKNVHATIREVQRCLVVKKPLEWAELPIMFQKIVDQKDVFYREHPRFPSRQAVEIENMQTGAKFKGVITNISEGGAFVEVHGIPLKTGDMIVLTFDLQEVGKVRQVHAEVRWVISKRNQEGHPGAGVMFISSDSLYAALLNKL